MSFVTRTIVWFAAEHHRAYLYRIATAAGGAAFFYGLATSEEVVLWMGVVATTFALPAANTSIAKKES